MSEQSARFESAWKLALEGGEPPIIDAFLGSVDGLERTKLIAELQRIERTYRVRVSFGRAETIATPPPALDEVETPAEVFLMPPDPTLRSTDLPPDPRLPSEEIEPELDPLPHGEKVDREPPATLPTLRLPGTIEDSLSGAEAQHPSALDADSIHLPLLDSWGRDVEAPPIPGTHRESSPPQPFVKGYEIVGELGRGGMGIVYKANQQGLNRLVAIKMVLGGDHAREEDLARFKIEAEAVASIQHPNIVQIYEVGDKDGIPYFSLEYIDGGTLHQRIDGKPQPAIEAAQIAHKLALAMGHFHERGVIHRDLKPANVLMTLSGSPKITDFGLAKRLEGNSSQTRTGSLMGTPSYMAPEQANGDTHAIGPLSDLYSLGAVLYEMLTGRPPFQGATMLDTLEQVRSQEPVPPRRLQPKIHRDLETICLKCLQKEPSKRYPGANQLAGDLERFLEGEPIKARPIGKPELAWRWVRRNPKIATLSTSIILITLMMVSLAIIGLIQKAREDQNISDARLINVDRLHRGRNEIEKGRIRSASEIVGVPDPFVERTPALADVRDDLRKLRAQVQGFAEFHRLLDIARFQALASERKLPLARKSLREAIAFHDEIEAHEGRARFGLPPLAPRALQLYKEDVFDLFLIAAEVEEQSEVASKEPEARLRAVKVAVGLLDRAEPILPPTRALYTRRQAYKHMLGDTTGEEADKLQGKAIEPNSPVDLFWRGFADRARGDSCKASDKAKADEFYRLARDNYARYIHARPEQFWGHLEWATCLYELGEWSTADIGYTRCIELNPEPPWPYHFRAKALRTVRSLDDALLDESAAITRDPSYPEALLERSLIYKDLGKISEAINDLNQCIAMAVSRGDLLQKGELTIQRGLLHYQSNDFEKALVDFETAVQDFPTQPLPYRLRAFARIRLNDIRGAESDWKKIAAAVPSNAEARYYLGVIRMGERRHEEALKLLEKSLALDPDLALASLAKARIFHWKGDDAAALKEINAVIARSETSGADSVTRASYLNERVDLYRNLGRLDESEADARRSIELDSSHLDAYLAMALLERKRGKPIDEVTAWYDRMLEAVPDSVETHLRRAEYFRDLGRWNQALAEADRASQLDSKRGSALPALIRASIEAARGDFTNSTSGAEAILEKTRRPDGHVLLAAASVFSLASRSASRAGHEIQAKSFADRAAGLLARALGEGFHDINYQEQERMILDPAFEPIAGRADVQRLFSFLP